MQFGEIIGVALSSLRANKLRSLLTMLGIVIGVASVIAMIALGTGAENAVKDRISRLGTTVFQINPQRVNQGGVSTTNMAKLTMKDVDSIVARGAHIAGVNPQQDRNMQVVWKKRNTNVQVTGTTSNFLEVRGFKLDIGRMFNDAEDRGRKRVAVIGAGVLPTLEVTDPAALMNERIRIAGKQFTVIGVLVNRGVSGVGDADNQILIPFNTGRFDVFGQDRVQDIWVRATSETAMDTAFFEVTSALRRSHRLRPDQASDFSIRNQADFLAVLSESAQTFTLLLSGIAAVSLLVGGIGIMNIMLVSVTERTREIGIRKALGATRRSILLQFMVEAVVLCLSGGLAGVAVGVAGAVLMQRSFGWQTGLSIYGMVLAFVFAGAIGMIFGVWPARRAAVLDPIVALRYE